MTDTSSAQREVLERLLDLTGQQEQALDAGDIVGLNRLSELRLQTVKTAAEILPPRQPWAPQCAIWPTPWSTARPGCNKASPGPLAAWKPSTSTS